VRKIKKNFSGFDDTLIFFGGALKTRRMVMEKHPPFTGRRRFERRYLNIVVSFSCQDTARGISAWHFGTIRNASINGIGIRTNRAVLLRRGRQLEILCLPDADQTLHGQEPFRIQGSVVWQDSEKQNFGLQYL
jgi:hypothetical protein